MIDLSDKELLWYSKDPYPIMKNKDGKVLIYKFIFKEDLNIRGVVDIKLKKDDRLIAIKNVEAETIKGHTVISKYI